MPDYHLVADAFLASDLGSLFHEPAFFRLHAGRAGRFFQWSSGREIVATIHLTEVKPGVWRSPARGTFAGYAWHPDLPVEQMFAFHDVVEAELARVGARRIDILPAPLAHDPQAFSNTLYVLRSRGFTLDRCDLNQSLAVSGTPLSDRMTYGNRKRLSKAARDGFSAGEVPLGALDAVYDTIAANRAMRGHAVSMRLDQLEEMARLFPDRVVLFSMARGEEMAASAVCLRLSAAVLYVFYWGDRPGYGRLSPVVTLAEAIYRWCQQSGIALLDVGTSTIDRDPNFGLIQFKRGLGFAESLKVQLSKVL